jgi:hypothetical protein
MTQAERDRMVALKKAKKKRITQKQAAEEIGVNGAAGAETPAQAAAERRPR